MFQPRNIYSVLSPMYFSTLLIGLTPFCIHTQTFKKSKLYLFWSILVMIFLNCYTTFSLTKRNRRKLEVISNITDTLDLILGQLGTCFGILFGCTSVNKKLKILEDINNFDKIVRSDFHVDLKKEYRKGIICIYTGLIVTAACIIIALIVTSMANGHVLDYIGLYLAYVCPTLINTFVDFQFCTLILCLKQRFIWLNTTVAATYCIQCNFKKSRNDFIRVRPAVQVMPARFVSDKTLDIIEKVRIRHHDLCTICRNINEIFSTRILLIVVQSFLTMTVLLYYAGDHILTVENISVKYLAYCGTQLTLSALQLLGLVLSCSAVSAEASKTAILIHKAMTSKEHNYKDDMHLEITLFSLQLLHHNVEFTACKLFVINEGLLFSIIGAVTTYLIIVIQFEIGTMQQHSK